VLQHIDAVSAVQAAREKAVAMTAEILAAVGKLDRDAEAGAVAARLGSGVAPALHTMAKALRVQAGALGVPAAAVDGFGGFEGQYERADLGNAHARLDISQAWGDGSTVAADGTHMDTYLNNLLSETSVCYGKPGGIAYHHISDSYIALFTHFIPCGVWEAVYIIEGLLKNTSEVKPTTVHADTQGQSFPVFFRRLTRVAISVREGAISSTLLRRLRAGPRKNATYIAFHEVGRVIRTVQLLRYLSDAPLRRRVTAATNKVEAFNGFSQWIGFGNGGVITDNDPVEQEKTAKFNALLTNAVICHPGHRRDRAPAPGGGPRHRPRGSSPHLAVPDRAHPPLRRVLHPRTRPPARGVRPSPDVDFSPLRGDDPPAPDGYGQAA
jgi:hypothetical protein